MSSALPEADFFRHEYGRLVAVLSRRLRLWHLEAVEDAVQSALLAAVEAWGRDGLPGNPSAWLFRVASNNLLGELRQRGRRERLRARQLSSVEESVQEEALLGGDVPDDLLRMLLVCCDDSIPVESQLVLALKLLCGFEVREIAERLFTSEAGVYKRLERARVRLRELPLVPNELSGEEIAARIPAVRAILYLLFTEGHLSSHPDTAIRGELCAEAIRLCEVLAQHPLGGTPETFALLALMHLHAARLASRQDHSGALVLLEEQDRSRWDREEIHLGLAWLAKAASGDVFSRFHAEAGIAAEHCLAPSLAETRWDRIVECYTLLERVAPSVVHTLNRAVAVAEWQGPEAGLAVLDGVEPPPWLAGSYLWLAVLSDLHRRCGHQALAAQHRDAAIQSAPTPALKALLLRRLGASLSG